MSGIKIPVSAELNQQDVQQQIKAVQAAFNDLGITAMQAGKIKFNPISKLSLEDAKKMRQEFDAMVRLAPGLQKALNAGGQGGKSFENIDWRQVWKDPKQRVGHAHTMAKFFDKFLAESAVSAPDRAPKSSGSGSGGARERKQSEPDEGGAGRAPAAAVPAWRRAAASGVAGIAGGVASQIGGLGGGVASGALAGGMVGGPVGAAIGGFAGAITSLLGSVGEARDIAISLDTLKRQLGDVNISFDELTGKSRSLADQFSLTDSEASSLTSRYARQAHSGTDLDALRREVGVGVGFSRSFGLDPSVGVDFFAQMRGMGVTQNADDNKRLALLIGESVAKAGQLPKMGEVLAGLQSFMQTTTANSLSTTGSDGWLGKMTALTGSGIPGMTPSTAANMIASANAAVSAGGITEAGKNWMSATLQRNLGLDPVLSGAQLSGGLFATGRSTFGEGSAIGRFLKANGGRTPGAANSDETNIEMLMRSLDQIYAGRPELKLDALHNQFGLTMGQAAGWHNAGTSKIGGIVARLKRLGVDPSTINETGISRLAQIEANGNLSEADKDRMSKEAATQNQEKTEGSEARQASINGANAMVRLANEGLPMISSIQNAVLKIAGIDPLGPAKAKAEAEHQKRVDEYRNKEGAELSEAERAYKDSTPWYKRMTGKGLTDEQQFAKDRYDAALDNYQAAKDAEKKRYQGEVDKIESPPAMPSTSSSAIPTPPVAAEQVNKAPSNLPSSISGATPELLSRAAESDRKLGFPAGTTAALMAQESSFNSNAVSSAGARGLHQIMPANVAAYSKRTGRQMDPTNTDDSFYMYEELMKERVRKYGADNMQMILRTYNGGYDQSKWGKENGDYVPAIERRKRELEAKYPQQMQHNVAVDVTMRDSAGNKMPDAQINTTVGAPKVSGSY